MLSGNGRHRRPRQAPALVVAAGVAGSAIAIPLLAASNASAATTQAWDRLAECESGGQWSLDAGNGYYGGLQFSQELWEQYGGLDFAPSADQASRSQQISVAEKVLDDQGPGAWPSCSITAGLSKSDSSAEVDPGASTPPPVLGGSSGGLLGIGGDANADKGEKNHDDGGNSDTPSDDASGDTSGNAKGDASDGKAGDEPGDGATASPSGDASTDEGDARGESDKSGPDDSTSPDGPKDSGAPDASPSASDPASEGSGAGRHRGGAASDDTADSRTGEGRHASRDDRRDGDAYTVRAGDNLWDIADSQGVDGGWTELYQLNKKAVGSDPDLILPGQSLDLGLESGEK
ncbi:transglycosylase family protein [Streptomyces xanthii]|uniref:Transglycosylase family protein n=1 Tax=Streptomyces xanthii TaxID=2768069 RepID=A0A7H1BAN9_9ACTN|nr:transglycosylase family protein [Streptomyces xanthii]